ncbi:4898_t:CDS:2, partial [Cetraspora pellucida]
HNIYEHLFDGKVGAPVRKKLQNGAKVLEFCCESGVWTSEVAAEYPNSEFYAVSSVQPESINKFNNITFIECDIFKRLPFPDNEFDYVFSKDKFLYMEKNKFQEVLLEIFRILKPGSWLEVIYSCTTDLVYGPSYKRLCGAMDSWYKVQNIDLEIIHNFENYLKKSGKTEDILCRTIDTQLNGGYAFGEFIIEIILFFYRSSRDYLAPFMNISFEEFDNLVNNAESELNSEDNKTTLRHIQKQDCEGYKSDVEMQK